jgi:hypothetical protein
MREVLKLLIRGKKQGTVSFEASIWKAELDEQTLLTHVGKSAHLNCIAVRMTVGDLPLWFYSNAVQSDYKFYRKRRNEKSRSTQTLLRAVKHFKRYHDCRKVQLSSH